MSAEEGAGWAQDPGRERTVTGTPGPRGPWEMVLASIGTETGIVMATEDFRNHPVQCFGFLAA